MKEREYSLDILKIVATFIIIFHHYQQVTGAFFQNGINFWNGKFYYGYVVELFFVLSGYFMYSYIRKIQNGLSFSEFWGKRFLRLVPLMALGAITYEVFLVIYKWIYGEAWMGITTTFWGTIIASLGIHDGWVFTNPFVNYPTWYISVLLLCYAIFYLIVYVSKRKNVPYVYMTIGVILLGIGINTYNINLPFLNLSSSRGYYAFFYGLLFHDILERGINKGVKIISFILCITIPLLIAYQNEFMATGINYTVTFLLYPALIIMFRSRFLHWVFNHRIVGIIGKISFDVYIWHNPFYILLYVLIKVFNWNINLNDPITMIMYALVCFVWGALSFYLIESPINRYIDQRRKVCMIKEK